MADESKAKQAERQVEELELNRETVQDLAEQEADQARGGRVPQTHRNCGVCTDPETGCI
jgi:hypothetical protein